MFWRKKSLVVFLVICLFISNACASHQMEHEVEHHQKATPKAQQNLDHDKKVMLIIFDSLMSPLLDSAIKDGQATALAYLIDNGSYYKDVVAPYPSMSVAIDSSIMTGVYPDQHQVPGLAWYHKDENRIVNYGMGKRILFKLGPGKSGEDVLFHLNNTHLSHDVKTIFEELQEKGKTTGSINGLIYRGHQEHVVSLPPIVQQMFFREKLKTKGPDYLSFGYFHDMEQVEQQPHLIQNIFQAFGLNDDFSTSLVVRLIREGKQPDFFSVYLPDFDHEVHRHGVNYREGLEATDQKIQHILDAYGDWDTALEENVFIVVGDHGQSQLSHDRETVAIDLFEAYREYDIARLTEHPDQGNIVFANNQRMTFVFSNDSIPLHELAEVAMRDSRIGVIAWEEQGWIEVRKGGEAGQLRFRRAAEEQADHDRYGFHWNWQGDLNVLDIQKEGRILTYDTYPDALRQIESAIHSHGIPT